MPDHRWKDIVWSSEAAKDEEMAWTQGRRITPAPQVPSPSVFVIDDEDEEEERRDSLELDSYRPLGNDEMGREAIEMQQVKPPAYTARDNNNNDNHTKNGAAPAKPAVINAPPRQLTEDNLNDISTASFNTDIEAGRQPGPTRSGRFHQMRATDKIVDIVIKVVVTLGILTISISIIYVIYAIVLEVMES